MATTLHIYDSKPLLEKMKAGDRSRVSSAPRYDEALLSIFPHFMYVSYDDARTLTQVIESGMQGRQGLEGVGSYASTMDFRTDGKVLWMSSSSYMTLKEWLNPKEYVIGEVPAHKLWGGTPTHMVGGE